MKCLVIPAALALVLVQAQPTFAWDPDHGDGVIEPPEATVWTPEPATVAPPEGIYLVTETYAGDSVIRSGAVTTYSTETAHEITGSYARVLDSVGTGGSSGYDGTAFNGRASLTDGRSVAGTYYENYIRTDDGFVPVSVVFFQDDREIARESAAAPTLPTLPTVAPVAGLAAPVRVSEPVGSASPVGSIAPFIDREDRWPASTVPAAQPPSAILPDRSIEVLRGRRIAISFSGVGVRAWRSLSSEGLALGALSGTAAEPFLIRWDRLAPPNAAWIARFLVDYADGTSHELLIHVAVRSPGLVQ